MKHIVTHVGVGVMVTMRSFACVLMRRAMLSTPGIIVCEARRAISDTYAGKRAPCLWPTGNWDYPSLCGYSTAVRNARASSFGARNCGGLGPNASPTRRTLGDFYVSVLCCFCCDIELAKLRRVAAISIRCADVMPRRVMLVVAAA